ncbi:hypothetical protein NC653_002953 [Populus alba x Populus x berolinensis]|uniref:Pentatricopeptide repeat-containing protein n=1 Tax=Populus alba x Populus x berolinensis TaxID=444605 RepID=A0AAD6RS04_9ROSI|nr:hypothetical protein NC653_002953 [Populus alba x Populus x berolinensis]
MKLSSSLLEDGNYVEPDVITPNTLIQGLCKGRRLDEAVEIYDTMIERGSFGNLFTFHILIGEYIKAGIIDKAMEVWKRVHELGLSKPGQMEEAEGVFDSMIASGITLDSRLYDSLIKGFG